ncbi:cell division protein FtsZ [Enterovirga sp.]|uniref:cell division protein FtsZ n=1 Tax=Enterovirga sp. TaxID=2026350 RepID=UPI002CCEF942|nr:cell division protein FtsZ [Enterovirga sp.]HMO28873.1 cell division protein FtsZ [Enterovirga sp.]
MINLGAPDIRELKPRITVFGVGGAGGNAVNNMIVSGLMGCEFVCANTDAQVLASSRCERIVQMGLGVTAGLGAGSQPEVGRAAAEEVIDEIRDQLSGSHMAFITAGMGGGTGTGAAPVVARAAREMGILTVGVVTKPFQFEGVRRMKIAEAGVAELQQHVDTLIVIPNQNLFRVANEKTTFADAFSMADQVLYSGVACITDLMVKEGLINLDFADVRSIMRGMGKAMMGTGEASGEKRAMRAAEAAIANPLLDEVSMRGARGLLISITGGRDLTLYELDEAATRIREEVDSEANIILGATFDESLEGTIRVSVVATGIDQPFEAEAPLSDTERRIAEVAEKLRAEARQRAAQASAPMQGEMATARAAEIVAQASMASPMPPSAAPAPAPLLRDEVTLTPVAPKGAGFEPIQHHHHAPVSHQEAAPAQPYLPPEPERIRQTRMPRIDELPMPAQKQIRAQGGQGETGGGEAKSFLRKLATVGFGRRDDAPASPAPVLPEPMPPSSRHMAHGDLPEAVRSMPPAGSEYAKRSPAAPGYRPAHGNLDGQGRVVPSPRTGDDEQLEIPAFLRRGNSA